jgi:uncharacterized protein
MPGFFERRDPFGNSPAVWVLAFTVFLLPIGWSAVQKIRLENNVENWLPPGDPGLQALAWAHEQFPSDERIFVSWDDSSLNDSRIDAVLARLEPVTDASGVLRGGSPYISAIAEPREVLALMQQNGVPAAEAVRRLEGMILGAGPLRIRLTEAARGRLKQCEALLVESARKELDLVLTLEPADPQLSSTAAIPVPVEPALTESTATVVESGRSTSTAASQTQTADGRPEAAPSASAVASDSKASDSSNPNSAASPAKRLFTLENAATPAVLSPDGQLIDESDVTHDLSLSWRGLGVGTPKTLQVAEWLQKLTLTLAAHQPAEKIVDSCFFVPGAPIALAVSLSDAGLADRSAALARIREATAEAGILPEQLRLGGSAVAASELNREVLHAAWNSNAPWFKLQQRSVMLTSALVGAILVYVLVRSIRLATVVLVASLACTFLAVALVPATGGTMNMVLVVMPSFLLVVTLSGGIHVANYWRNSHGLGPMPAVVQAYQRAIVPCFLAAGTTAVGLASLCTSSLSPVRDFGLYSAVGTLLSFLAVVYVVPALLLVWPASPPSASDSSHPGWYRFGRAVTARPVLQTCVTLLLCGVMSAGLLYFRTETKVIRYFSEQSRVVQDYWFLEGHLAGIVPIETIIRFDEPAQHETNFLDRMELVREVEVQLRQHPEITGCLSLPDFQPVSDIAADETSRLALARYHKRASLAEQRIRSGEIEGTNAFYSVATAPAALQTSTGPLSVVPGDELWRITAQVNVMTDADYAVVLSEVDRLAQEVLRLQGGTRHLVTGTVPVFLRTQQAVLDSLITSFGLAFAVILAVFVLLLKSVPAALVAMIPNVLPITVVFGVASFAGLKTDIGSMITASIALGMAVDGTLHFLSWFQQKLKAGVPRREAVVSAVLHSGPAIWQTSWVVALGLLMLVPAELLLISRFGWLMAAMVLAAMVGDLVLLPQLLATRLGDLFISRGGLPAAVTDLEPTAATEIDVALESSSSAPVRDSAAAAVSQRGRTAMQFKPAH